MSDLAAQYKKTYDIAFGVLSPSMKKRVLAVKEDPTLKDNDVNEFIHDVIEKAEEIHDKREEKRLKDKQPPAK